ncbi:MAG: GNAT family N-acetyltransferase [Desulfobacteraceae bacterium]|nr:GNAT family N-acetyltransferase [Desulfobacteraceae bacterium]
MKTEEITLLRRTGLSNSKQAVCTLRRLLLSDLHQIMQLQERIVRALPDKNLFYPDTADFYISMINSSKNLVEGIFFNGKLIAFSLLLIPDSLDYNLGVDIGLSQEDLSSVAHAEMIFVDPAFRGNKLQRFFLKRRIEYASDNGYFIILTTVAPSNKASLNNLRKSGFKILKPNVIKYGGMLRHILQYQPIIEKSSETKQESAVDCDKVRIL